MPPGVVRTVITKPYRLDLDPDDLDRGIYRVSADDGYFDFDGFGSEYDVFGGVDIIACVQDCQFNLGCNNKDNFVWFPVDHPVNGVHLNLLLNGTADSFGPGPQSEQLPGASLLQEIANFGGNFEIDAPDYSEVLLTSFATPSDMHISIDEIPQPVPVPSSSALLLACLLFLSLCGQSNLKMKCIANAVK